ncbi:hypothetical protein ACFP63_04625 [Oerskovia jenensis]|uniref:Uncharacterized protein n=1 Tax=Oerskovia jenensis TaxID=162169 RepID=A0ABS2LDP7_9CELL|nr:hypothetical protein [Oerskovia jenensis]MBM7478233.1 hypothetical protein [Oerskovia jenensis]
MSSTVTVRPAKGVGVIGILTVIAGIVMIIAGGVTWGVVTSQLSAEDITVSDDADFLAGRHVNGPFTAYAQAEVINKHALEISDGQTYAELPQDDERRATVMNASFLRASLFTSVVAYGVSALVIGLGILFILIGIALRRIASGPAVAVETAGGYSSDGNLSAAPVPATHTPAHAAPVTPAPTTPAPTTPTTPPVTPPTRTSTHAAPVEEPKSPGVPTTHTDPLVEPKSPGVPTTHTDPLVEPKSPGVPPTGTDTPPATPPAGDTPPR